MSDSESEDNYTCEFCNIIIDNENKAILRHKRICESNPQNNKLIFNELNHNYSININNNSNKDIYLEEEDNSNNSNNTTLLDDMLISGMIEVDDKNYIPITIEMILKNNAANINKNSKRKNSNNLNEIITKVNKLEHLDLSCMNLNFIYNKKNIDFTLFQSLIKIDISNNKIKSLEFINYLAFQNSFSITNINISNNLIENIHNIESFVNLSIFDCSFNKITNISSLAKFNKLSVLIINNNNLCYTSSTIKILRELRYLNNLSIHSNPFLNEINGYKHILIHKIKSLNILDNKTITDIDCDLAKEYFNNNELNNTWYLQEKENNNLNYDKNNEVNNKNITNKINYNKEENYNLVTTNKGKVISNIKCLSLQSKCNSKIEKSSIHIKKDNKSTLYNKKNSNNKINDNKDYEQLLKALKLSNEKVKSLELQLENSENINKTLELEINNIKNEKDKLEISIKQVISTGKDKQLKIEK